MGPSSGVSSNTYGSGPGYGNEAGYRDANVADARNAGGSTNAGPHDSKVANKVDPRVDSDLDNRRNYSGTTDSQNVGPQNAGMNAGGRTNAGPHDSNVANKMDPRVDSDLDNRRNYPGTTDSQNVGSQDTGSGARGFDPSSTGSIGQSRGIDNHMTSEDNYSSSKEEKKSRTQPLTSDNKMTSEESYSNATQEHKSHSTTAHAEPCEMEPRAQPGHGSRMGQQNFGGGATGGSSYNDNNSGARGLSGPENPQQMNKLDPRGQGSNYQQNPVGNQRGGY